MADRNTQFVVFAAIFKCLIASNLYCNMDMQYSVCVMQIFVATYVVITFLETRDISNSAIYCSCTGTIIMYIQLILRCLIVIQMAVDTMVATSARSHQQSLHSFYYTQNEGALQRSH